MPERNKDHFRDYDRALLRGSVNSLFWAVINDRRQNGSYKLQELADALGVDKGLVSRWLSGDPNYRLNTAADIGGALGVDIEVTARDRETGRRFGPSGLIVQTVVGHAQTPGVFSGGNLAGEQCARMIEILEKVRRRRLGCRFASPQRLQGPKA